MDPKFILNSRKF